MRQSTDNFLALSWFFLFSGPASQSCILRTHVLIGSLYICSAGNSITMSR